MKGTASLFQPIKSNAMKKLIIIALVLLCTAVISSAQNAVQALRYSRYEPFGTSRFLSQAGATGALGGDLSSALINPAGLAFYRTSEFSVSPSLYWVNTRSDFKGSVTDDSELKFNIGSLGLVNSFNSNNQSGFVSASWAIGYQTLANFNNRTTLMTINQTSSLLDDFVWHANQDPDNLDPFYEQLAFDTYLMPYDEEAEMYWHDMAIDGYGQEQSRLSQQSGYIGEYSLSGAVNFSNLLYFGAALGIHSVRFSEEIYHTETDLNDRIVDFDQFRFREFNSTRGWGYTFRMGMILRPAQLFRVGASFQLPTYYRLTDEKFTDMRSYWDRGSGIEDASDDSPSGIYDYQLRTPFRANAHLSVIVLKAASLSAGYEYVDYSNSRLDAYDYRFMDENDQIRGDFRAAHNISAGAEIRIQSLYLRGGTRYMMSPFKDESIESDTWVYTGGLGFRTRSMYLDLGFAHSGRTEVQGLYAYEPGLNEVTINDRKANTLMLTVGFRF